MFADESAQLSSSQPSCSRHLAQSEATTASLSEGRLQPDPFALDYQASCAVGSLMCSLSASLGRSVCRRSASAASDSHVRRYSRSCDQHAHSRLIETLCQWETGRRSSRQLDACRWRHWQRSRLMPAQDLAKALGSLPASNSPLSVAPADPLRLGSSSSASSASSRS